MSNSLCSPIISKAGGTSGLLMDLAANEKDVHADFYNGKVFVLFRWFRISLALPNMHIIFEILFFIIDFRFWGFIWWKWRSTLDKQPTKSNLLNVT